MIKSLYSNQGYLAIYGSDVIITGALIAGTIAITSYSTYQTLLLKIRTDWSVNRCNPIYMPFAGLIMPQPGVPGLETTVQNFSYCIQQDASMVFSIALLPLEFTLYMVIDFIDMVMDAIVAFLELMQWLESQVGGITTQIYGEILNFIIPLVEITIHMRDALAKINGIAVTSLYVTMSVYNTTVSGLINIMNILTELLLALISVIVAMFILAFVLLVTPAFPLGLTTYAAATSVMASIIIPTIIMYTLMHTFTDVVMKETASSPPSVPKVKKK